MKRKVIINFFEAFVVIKKKPKLFELLAMKTFDCEEQLMKVKMKLERKAKAYSDLLENDKNLLLE